MSTRAHRALALALWFGIIGAAAIAQAEDADEPTADETADEPTADEPTAEEPTAEEPAAEEPAAEEPAAEEPAAEEKTYGPPPVDPTAPWLWVYGAIGGGAFNLGLMGKARVQIRGAMLRNDSVLFQTTYAGAGLEVGITPAFVQFGPRFSIAPIEIFDFDAHFSWMHIWKSSSGMLPFEGLTGTLEKDREAIEHLAIPGHRFEASLSPTLKLKVGPVIGLWNSEWAFIHHIKSDAQTSTYVYEPLRDLVINWDEMIVTNLAAILIEVADGTGPKGGPGPVLRFGPVMRDKQTLVSRDMATVLGGAVSLKPGPKRGWPDVFVAVMGYVRDNDRFLKAPQIQLQISWKLEKSLKKKDPAREVVAALR